MSWSISQTSVDFSANRGVVVLADAGSASAGARSINVSFPLGPLNQPPPTSTDKQTLIRLAKQVLTDAVFGRSQKTLTRLGAPATSCRRVLPRS
jgi:hypothetical protein